MIRALGLGKLVTDLNGNFHRILNLGGFDPVPSDIVAIDDARLSDKRPVLDGTVTNDSVADNANISQSKLSLSGDIPSNFLGIKQAAKGDLVQTVTGKGQPNGYAALGADRKLLTGTVPTLGTGTLHEIDFDFPPNDATPDMIESG